MEVPPVVRKFYSYFPLYTYESEAVRSAPNNPTLWVSPPTVPPSRLSGDIECLKWQTYLVLRNVSEVRFRYDIQPDGGVGGILPCLHLPNGDFLSPSRIPLWANDTLKESINEAEGCASLALRDESRAWISLFEGIIHSALVSCSPCLKRPQPEAFPSSLFSPHLTLYHPFWTLRMTARDPMKI